MKSRDDLAHQVEVPGARIATPSAAALRPGSGLDLATVLQEAADSAGTLTNARYSLIAAIVTIGGTGEAREFYLRETSSPACGGRATGFTRLSSAASHRTPPNRRPGLRLSLLPAFHEKYPVFSFFIPGWA